MTNLKLRTGITSRTSQNWLTYVAQEKGFWAGAGLEHEYFSFKDMAEGTRLLGNGEVGLGTQMADTPILAEVQGVPVKIIASLVQKGFGHVMGSRVCKSIADLKGRPVGGIDLYSGSTVMLREILRRGGLEGKDYEMVHVGGTPERFAALKSGQVDAVFLSPPYDFQAMEEGFTVLADYAAHFPCYPLTLNANATFLKSNRDTVVKFLQGLIWACRWLLDPANKKEAIAILEKSTGVPSSYAALTYNYVLEAVKGLPEDCRVDLGGLKEILQFLAAAGKVARTVAPDQFVDLSFLEEALANTPA